MITATVNQKVLIRNGRGRHEGVVIELLDEGRRARVRIDRPGLEPLTLVRNVIFLDPIPAAPKRRQPATPK